MANEYSKLLIDSSKIYETIDLWCKNHLEGDYSIKKKETPVRIFYIIINGAKEIKIDFLVAKGGLLTICYKVGKHQDISKEIAEEVYCKLGSNLNKASGSNGYSVKISYEDFEALVKLTLERDDIKQDSYSVQDEAGKANYVLYRLKSKLNDTVTLKYYPKTTTLQVQGKQLLAYNAVTTMLQDFVEDLDAVIDYSIEYYNLNIKRDELYIELSEILGKELGGYLTRAQRAIFASSIVQSRIKVDGLEDYSYMIMPALKVYEGFMIKMLADDGLPLPLGKQVNWFFIKSEMAEQYSSIVGEVKKELYESMYEFLQKYRNPHMHTTADALTTKMVGTYNEAKMYLEETISNMKVSYKIFKK